MSDKLTQTRNYILDMLESGAIKAGEKLLAARDIAKNMDISFAKVQQAIEQLVQDGVLETIPRQGTYVQRNWQERSLQTNVTIFSPDLPWLPDLQQILEQKIPQLRLCSKFKKSALELRTTLAVQGNRDEYMDLTEIFNRLYPDKSIFFSHPFKTFYMDGKLPGIPFIFSPRVIFFNPKILEKAGCEQPRAGWTWEDFINTIKKVRTILPPEKIFNWDYQAYNWMNFVFRAGGCLIAKDAENPVRIDDPKTQHGLRLYAELKDALGLSKTDWQSSKYFLNGEAAFAIKAREFIPYLKEAGMTDWNVVPLPYIPGGQDITAQATDLLCVRKSCTSPQLAEQYIKLMLSDEVQDFIASQKYGIPIRKSAAFKSLDIEDPMDSMFLAESSKITAEYNLSSPELSTLIREGIKQIFENNQDIEIATKRLADAVRTFLDIKYKGSFHDAIHEMEAV